MVQDWEFRGRTNCCGVTGRRFVDGEIFYTLLYRTKTGFDRQDLSKEAWKERDKNRELFSFWKTKYEVAPPPPAEAFAKESAEGLLRRFIEEDKPEMVNARYILALMLERKRILRPVDTREAEEGRWLIYERAKTGEVFMVLDPQLKMSQVEAVQMEVAELLK